MSEAVWPSLPGLTWNVTRTPLWKTLVQEAASGKETRVGLYSYPRYKWSLTYEMLRSGADAELQALVGFFNARQGRLDSFLYTDPTDCAVTAHQFGVGDAATVAFQLVRSFGGFVEPVKALNGAPLIYIGGVLKATPADYSVSSTGLVTFTSPPAGSAVLTWTGSYYWRVRFEEDENEFNNFMYQLWELKKVEFISDKV